MPWHVVTHMRTADTFASLALEEVRIVLAPHEASRVLVYRVISRHIAKIWHSQEARHIGIVHKQLVAKAVYLEGIDVAILRMVVDSIFLECRLHLVGQIRAALCCRRVIVHLGEDVGSLAQTTHRHEVGRHEEEICRGIVGRTEIAGNEAARFHGRSPSVAADSVELTLCDALEMIGSASVFLLLLHEHTQYVVDSLFPYIAKDGSVASLLPIGVGQAYGIAE